MGIADFFRKIGVLKSGSATYKGDVSEAPVTDVDGIPMEKEEEKKKENESTSIDTDIS